MRHTGSLLNTWHIKTCCACWMAREAGYLQVSPRDPDVFVALGVMENINSGLAAGQTRVLRDKTPRHNQELLCFLFLMHGTWLHFISRCLLRRATPLAKETWTRPSRQFFPEYAAKSSRLLFYRLGVCGCRVCRVVVGSLYNSVPLRKLTNV